MTLDELRELYRAAVKATRLADAAKAQAQRLQAVYYEELAKEHAARVVPIGYCIDVLGDGTVKPEAECARDIKQ